MGFPLSFTIAPIFPSGPTFSSICRHVAIPTLLLRSRQPPASTYGVVSMSSITLSTLSMCNGQLLGSNYMVRPTSPFIYISLMTSDLAQVPTTPPTVLLCIMNLVISLMAKFSINRVLLGCNFLLEAFKF
jgi:hypothetical protein